VAARRAGIPLAGAVATLLAMCGALPAGAQTSTQTLSPTNLAFGAVVVGASSSPLELTFTSNAPVTINVVSVSGQFGPAGGSCGPGVVVGGATASCTVSVVFTPSSAGAQAGDVTVAYGTAPVLSRRSALSGTATVATTSTRPEPTTTSTVPRTTSPPQTSTTRALPSTTRPAGPSTTLGPGEAPPETVETTTTTSTTAPGSLLPGPPPPTGRSVTLDATAAGGRRSGPAGIGLTLVGTG